MIKVKNELNALGEGSSIQRPFVLYGLENISIGSHFLAGRNGKLRTYSFFSGKKHRPFIMIGDNVHFETDCYLSAIGRISIGDNVTLASYVTIIDHNHGAVDYSDLEIPVMQRQLSTKGDISIEDNVWIGEHAVILSGVTIGKNSIIGANSVVTKSIPENCVAAGIPAKVIKKI
jgi:acetyltransferase-like isoleucine patch superfamily enzyme